MVKELPLTNYSPPRYKAEEDVKHYRILNKRIRSRIKQESKSNWSVQLKAILFPLLYMALFGFTILSYPSLPLFYLGYFLLGLFVVIIFLTVIHEVSHDIVFKARWKNRLVLHFFDLIGANSYIWQKRHRLMHHNYPNVNGWDTDIEQSNTFKVFPDAPHNKFHNNQHRLMFLLYPLYLFNWLIIRDFKDFFKKDSTIKKAVQIPRIEYIKLFLFKGIYLSYMFVIPIFFLKIPWYHVFLGFLLLTLCASIFALAVLLPPHANVSNEFPKVQSGNTLNHTWLEHQLATTSDITNTNWAIRHLMGNFNYHVAHHLYPDISYVHMKAVTEEIQKYAGENNFQYKAHGFWEALRNHYYLIRSNAMHESVLNETI